MAEEKWDDAFEIIRRTLEQWGLTELLEDARKMMIDGADADMVPLRLRSTEAYKKRFAANFERQKKGLALLSEAEFLATESALRTVVRRYVGAGAYDSNENLSKWIANDLSPQELNDRMSLYARNFLDQPEDFKQAWYSQGFTPRDAITVAMDPAVTESTLRRKLNGVGIAAEAFRAYGAARFDDKRFEDYAEAGLTSEDARDGFTKVATRGDNESKLAALAGETLTREEQESEELLGNADVTKRRQKYQGQERSRFDQNYMGGTTALRRSGSGSF